MQPIELFSESDWNEVDRNAFLKRKFILLTYQQIAETKMGDLAKSDKTQNLILGILEEENVDAKIGDLTSFYAIGEVQTQQISASKVALYNNTLLSMIKNKYTSNLLKKYKRINNIGAFYFCFLPIINVTRAQVCHGDGPVFQGFQGKFKESVQRVLVI